MSVEKKKEKWDSQKILKKITFEDLGSLYLPPREQYDFDNAKVIEVKEAILAKESPKYICLCRLSKALYELHRTIMLIWTNYKTQIQVISLQDDKTQRPSLETCYGYIEEIEEFIKVAYIFALEGAEYFFCPLTEEAFDIMQTFEIIFINLEGEKGIGTDYFLNAFFPAALEMSKDLCKDLCLLSTRIAKTAASMIYHGEILLKKLHKKDAEVAVKKILEDNPHIYWTLRKIEEHLRGLGYVYSHVSISKLNSWKKWDEEYPRGKPQILNLTNRRFKSIDNAGKTYFSTEKKASNISKEDD